MLKKPRVEPEEITQKELGFFRLHREFREHLAAAVADVSALVKYRPLFARLQALAEGCDDTEMAIGIDLMNFALRVYAQLKLSASDSLKGLLDSLGGFFGGGSSK